NSLGCTASTSIVVTQNTAGPNLTISTAPLLTCINTTAILHALSIDTGLTFSWTGPGIVGTNIGATITINAAGVYVVVATNAFGCTATLSITVTQNLTAPNLTVS